MPVRFGLFPVLLFLGVASAEGQDQVHPYDIAHQKIQQILEQKRKEFADDPDKLVLESIVADRKLKRVEVWGCATAVGDTEPIEFFITPVVSGKDYESLAVTWCKPSDLHKAMEFIGLKPGRPINFVTNHHWTRGPRVIVTVDSGKGPVRIEDLILNAPEKKTLPQTGMVFTGSFTHTDEQGQSHYAADVVDSRAIAPNYNDPVAVLDMPLRLAQSDVYGFQVRNPAHAVPLGHLLTFIIQPATGKEAVELHDLVIEVGLNESKPIYTALEQEKERFRADSLADLVRSLSLLVDGSSDWFTTARIDPSIRVTDVRKMYAVLMTLEQDRGIKLDPPAGENLFHRAFFPQDAWRNRQERLGEPWELFLARQQGKIVARLERYVELFEPERRLELQRFEVQSPQEFVKTINDHASQWSQMIFIYPPEDLTYGELMQWAGPAFKTYPRIFVFTPDRTPELPKKNQSRDGSDDSGSGS